MRKQRGTIIAIVVLVLALVAGGGYWLAARRGSGSGADSIGADVTVSGTMPTTAVHAALSAATVSSPYRLVSPISKTFSLAPSGPMARPLTIILPLMAKPPAGDAIVVETAESSNGPWNLLPATVTADGAHARFTATHLSFFRVLEVLVGRAVSSLKQDLIDDLSAGLTASARRPVCAGAAAATAAGYSLATRNGEDAVLACLGEESGHVVLKIVNNRRYPLQMTHANATVLNQGATLFHLDELARLVSGPETLAYPLQEVDFGPALPSSGGTAVLQTSEATLAQDFYQLEVGVTTALQLLTEFGAGSGVAVDGKIVGQLPVVDATNKLVGLATCSALFLGRDGAFTVGKLFADCFSPADLLDVWGVKALLLAPVLAVSPVIAFFQSEFNALGDQFDGRSNETVQVTRTNVNSLFVPYVGTWAVHDTALTIDADLTGSSWQSLGPCTPAVSVFAYCYELKQYSFAVTQSGVTATITSLRYVQGNQDSNGNVINQQPPPAGFTETDQQHVGEVFHLSMGTQDTLVEEDQQGNRFTWCGPHTPYSTGLCGG